MKKMNVMAFVMIISYLLLSQALAELSSSSNAAETSSASQFQTNDENQTAAFKRTHHRPRFNCGYACARRCSETSRKNVCYRACGSCCAKCQCVPPGTSGNTAACPCYANLRTHGNKLKCP
ncbi:PREDICTED: gibberellin-regulated protein 9-like isoform X1 [Camelina sativa]|uniref:Gibberellin-regulated protein 9-like isoform X1 n=1 Tax=Camelina sativa TaxID=90675 RepID=A0ABM0VRD4_CAMSA|nr:PREDICTED: gibberellin-regulated protein 9-like isoform X1 [Camelina sativa]